MLRGPWFSHILGLTWPTVTLSCYLRDVFSLLRILEVLDLCIFELVTPGFGEELLGLRMKAYNLRTRQIETDCPDSGQDLSSFRHIGYWAVAQAAVNPDVCSSKTCTDENAFLQHYAGIEPTKEALQGEAEGRFRRYRRLRRRRRRGDPGYYRKESTTAPPSDVTTPPATTTPTTTMPTTTTVPGRKSL
eukprot:s2697_g6.t1